MLIDPRIKMVKFGGNEIWVKEYESILPQKECYVIESKLPLQLKAQLLENNGFKFIVDIYRRFGVTVGAIDLQKIFSALLYLRPNMIEKYGLSFVVNNFGAVLCFKVGELHAAPLLYILDPEDLPEVFTVKRAGRRKLVHISSSFPMEHTSISEISEEEITRLKASIKDRTLLIKHIQSYGLWNLCEPIIHDALEILLAILDSRTKPAHIPMALCQVRKKLAYVQNKCKVRADTPRYERQFTELCRQALMYITNKIYELHHLPHVSEKYENELERLVPRCKEITNPIFLEWSSVIESCITRIIQGDISICSMNNQNRTLDLFAQVAELLTYALTAAKQTQLERDKKIRLFVSRVEGVAQPDLAVTKLKEIFSKRYPDIKLVFGAEGYFGEDLEKRLFYFLYMCDAQLALFLKEPIFTYNGTQKSHDWVVKEMKWAETMHKRVIRVAEKGAPTKIPEISNRECISFSLDDMHSDTTFLRELDLAIANLRLKIAKDRLVSLAESLPPRAKENFQKLFNASEDKKFVTPDNVNEDSNNSVQGHLDQLSKITHSIRWTTGIPLVLRSRIGKRNYYKSNIFNFMQATLSYFTCQAHSDILRRLSDEIFKIKLGGDKAPNKGLCL